MSEHDVWSEGYVAGLRAAHWTPDDEPIVNPYPEYPAGGYIANPDTKAMHTSVVLHHGERATSAAGVVHWWDATTRQWLPLDEPPTTT